MEEERIIFKGSSSPLHYLGTFTLGFVVALGAAIAAILLPPFSIALAALAAVALIYMGAVWLYNRTRVYEITTERIRLQRGILTRRTDEMELYRVQDLTLIEPIKQRMFGLGTLAMSTMDTTTPELKVEAIRGASQVREELRKSIEICRDRKRVRVAELE